jgi:hypothetical protein
MVLGTWCLVNGKYIKAGNIILDLLEDKAQVQLQRTNNSLILHPAKLICINTSKND